MAAFKEIKQFSIREFLKPRPSPSPPKSSLPKGREKLFSGGRKGRGYTRSEFKTILKGAWKGSRLNEQQRIGLEKELFPWQRHGSHISEEGIKSTLRKLRRDEYWAKTSGEREEISKRRKTLEEATGFKGKY